MYKVFLAHSSKNMDLVVSLAEMLHSTKIDVYVAEFNPEPGEYLDEKINRNLLGSDAVLALLTREGNNSNWVWREIRWAIENRKMVIPLIEKGIKIPDILKDIEYLIFDRKNYIFSYKIINERISALNQKKMRESTIQANGPENTNTNVALIVLAVVALFIIVIMAAEVSRS